MCGRSDAKLDAHHILNRKTLPNDGYALSNGITLCDCQGGCHMKAEQFHIHEGLWWESGFHPDELLSLIGSSREQAQADSAALS